MRLKFLISRAPAFTLACLLAAAFPACNHDAAPTPVPSADAAFSDKGVSFGGKLIPIPGTEKDVVAALGEPSRKVEKAGTNTIYVWDDKGILAYFPAGTDKCISVTIDLKPETYDFSPKSTFAHNIVVGGKSLNKSAVPQLADAGFKAVPMAPIIWEGQIGNLSTGATTDGKEISDISLSIPAAP